MLKPARSPVLGYNHNVKYRGRVFHVQTEDSGPVNPRIFTHLYFGGTILASKRHEYDNQSAPEIVRALMQSQHKSILKDLKNGRHDAQLQQFFAARGEALDTVAPGGAPEDDFTEEATPVPPRGSAEVAPVVSAAPPIAGGALEFKNVVAAAAAPANAAPLPSERTPPPSEPALPALPTVAPRVFKGTPALGSIVRVERVVTVGEKTPPPSLLARARRPAPSIPYVVQEGSHPVVTPPPELDPPAALVTPTSASGIINAPPTPPVPLAPPPVTAETASITAANVGALPTVIVNPEDSQSLDEVIMAYLARGVNRDDAGVG